MEEALLGSPSQRLGVAQVASANVGKVEHRHWCERQLRHLFDDDDHDVRREAAMCFGRLEGQSMEAYEDLILKFCDSAAYQDDSFHLLDALERSTYRLPGITMVACEKFFERFARRRGIFAPTGLSMDPPPQNSSCELTTSTSRTSGLQNAWTS